MRANWSYIYCIYRWLREISLVSKIEAQELVEVASWALIRIQGQDAEITSVFPNGVAQRHRACAELATQFKVLLYLYLNFLGLKYVFAIYYCL